ncbi:hypothetical protein PG995_004288 [Apiospora arundinis]
MRRPPFTREFAGFQLSARFAAVAAAAVFHVGTQTLEGDREFSRSGAILAARAAVHTIFPVLSPNQPHNMKLLLPCLFIATFSLMETLALPTTPKEEIPTSPTVWDDGFSSTATNQLGRKRDIGDSVWDDGFSSIATNNGQKK